MELSRLAGLTRKETVETFDPENLSLREAGYNAVFSKEALFAMDNKEEILTSIYNCLRIDGQLLMTDYLAPSPRPRAARLTLGWSRNRFDQNYGHLSKRAPLLPIWGLKSELPKILRRFYRQYGPQCGATARLGAGNSRQIQNVGQSIEGFRERRSVCVLNLRS